MEQSHKEKKKVGTSRSSSLPLLTTPVASNQCLTCVQHLLPLTESKGFVRRRHPAVDLPRPPGLGNVEEAVPWSRASRHPISAHHLHDTRPNVSALVRSTISSSLMPISPGFTFVSQSKAYLSMDPGSQCSTGGCGQRETLLEIHDRHHPANDVPSLVPPQGAWRSSHLSGAATCR